MISIRPLLLALAGGALLSPLAAAAQPQTQPAESPPAAEAQSDDAKGDEVAGEDKRICRHVRLDMSSRRKTKVCRTVEEWRELNNPR